jgi:hypothetical protein
LLQYVRRRKKLITLTPDELMRDSEGK